uniref:Uncharacterized protein n=1 Tax=Arundo donax TaxID=35708 RepID=A0A0A9BA49_ARUDO
MISSLILSMRTKCNSLRNGNFSIGGRVDQFWQCSK